MSQVEEKSHLLTAVNSSAGQKVINSESISELLKAQPPDKDIKVSLASINVARTPQGGRNVHGGTVLEEVD